MFETGKSILQKDLHLSDNSNNEAINPKYFSMTSQEMIAMILIITDRMKKKMKTIKRKTITKI